MLLIYPKSEKETFPDTYSNQSERSSKMSTRKSKTPSTGDELGLKLLQSVREMKAGQFARVTPVAVNEVVEARQGTGMPQSEFAAALQISTRTLQEWEQGRRSPSSAAQALIRIAKRHPEVLREALA